MTTGSGGGALEVALDVSAVPERPVGAGRYVVELARALAGRDDCRLTLLARRDDCARWALTAPGERVDAVEGALDRKPVADKNGRDLVGVRGVAGCNERAVGHDGATVSARR